MHGGHQLDAFHPVDDTVVQLDRDRNDPFGTPGMEFKPSITVISHGGRRRSSWRPWMRAI